MRKSPDVEVDRHIARHADIRNEFKTAPRDLRSALPLRVENQLGYKMVKWIKEISFVHSEKEVLIGKGGKDEEYEYFDLLPNIACKS